MPRAGIRWTIHPKGIVNTGTQLLNKDVPEVERFVDVRIEFDDLKRLRIIVILKKQQIDGGGDATILCPRPGS